VYIDQRPEQAILSTPPAKLAKAQLVFISVTRGGFLLVASTTTAKRYRSYFAVDVAKRGNHEHLW
jgi:hypothetical protein